MTKTTETPRREKRGRHEAADGGTLSPRQEAFAQAYALSGKTATQAMIDAGYSAKSARAQAFDMLRNPKVKARLAQIREAITQQTVFDAAAAFDLLTRLLDKAEAAGDLKAAGKFSEQLLRMHGLFNDKLHIEQTTVVDLAGALREARSRAAEVQLVRPMCDPALAIDAEFRALPSVCDAGPCDNQSHAPVLDLAAARSRADGVARSESAAVAPGADSAAGIFE